MSILFSFQQFFCSIILGDTAGFTCNYPPECGSEEVGLAKPAGGDRATLIGLLFHLVTKSGSVCLECLACPSLFSSKSQGDGYALNKLNRIDEYGFGSSAQGMTLQDLTHFMIERVHFLFLKHELDLVHEKLEELGTLVMQKGELVPVFCALSKWFI